MVGLIVIGLLVASLPVLALHLFAIALTKALRSYSPSLLEERCGARGRPERAEEVAHLDQRTERSAEALAVLTGLLLAALVGMGVDRLGPSSRLEWLILLVLGIGLLGYVLAGVIGKVFAETIIDATWPASAAVRAAAVPLTFGLRQVERLVEWSAGASEAPQRPASVEVEIPIRGGGPGGRRARPPRAGPRAARSATIELTRTDVSEIMTPRPLIVSLPRRPSRPRSAAATFRQTRPEPHPDLRRQSRRHRRHPLRQGPVRPHDRGQGPDQGQSSQAGAACPFRPGDQERLRAAGRAANQATPDRDRAGRVRRRGRTGDAGRPARGAGRRDRRRARHPDHGRAGPRTGRFALRG